MSIVPPAATTPAPKKQAILFVDEQPGIDDQIRSPECRVVLVQSGFQILLARSRKAAQLILAEAKYDVRVVVVSRTLDEDGVSTLTRFAQQKSIKCAFYALATAEETANELSPDLKTLGVKGWVTRPLAAAQLKDVVLANIRGFHASLTADAAQKDQTSVGEEMVTDEKIMVSIRAKGLMAGTKSFFDVYMRLGVGKFVKIVKAGDVPSVEQIGKYLSKGIQLFYIRKDIQEAYVRYCEQVAATLIANENVDKDVKVGRTLNQGQEAFNLLRAQGVNQENMRHAGSFVLNVSKVVKDYNLVDNDTISSFLSKVSGYEHNTRVAAMCGILALQLKLDSERSAHIIGMAGLLHDVGLMKLGLDEAMGEREHYLSEDERKLYETHPKVGSEVLAELRRFDPTVVQAVAQHHIRRNASGFPDRSNFTHIHICAEIIGIVDEYDYILKRKSTDPTISVRTELSKIYEGFSRQVVQGFQQAFLVGDQERTGALVL
jgi:response regulator RpfG family c-di-GMP phosphodiesterase